MYAAILRSRAVVAVATVAFVVVPAGPAWAQLQRDALVQAPTLARPERGSLVGSLAKQSFGARDLERGVFSLPAAIALPAERGGPLLSVVPNYSPESGISEWGVGWSTSLSIVRFRVLGDFDYQTDEFTSPWGRLQKGSDGDYYPRGLRGSVRLRRVLGAWQAILPDGTRVDFDRDVLTEGGTYAWYATRAETVLGDSTEIEYLENSSGRQFVSRAYYGARGHTRAHRVDFAYEALPQTVSDYRSGQRMDLDRRVTRVVTHSQHADLGTYQVRWRVDLTYLDSELGPAFFLRSATTTYASGAAEPPVTYDYDLGEQRVGSELRYLAGPLEEVPTLLDYLAVVYDPDGLQPDRAATFDDKENGLPDLEWAVDFSLFRQDASGHFTMESPPPLADNANFLCRPGDSLYNGPRNLVRMEGPGTAPQVLVLDAHWAVTEVLVCDRSGSVLHQEVIDGSWVLGANTRVVDVNRDQKPDLVYIDYGEVHILENISGEGCEPGSAGPCTPFGFRPHPVRYLDFVYGRPFEPTATWVNDMNGDGHPDLILRYDEGVSVWYGTGHGIFDPVEHEFPFFNRNGWPMTQVSAFEIAWVDPNKDGHADAMLSVPGESYLFMNRGSDFLEVRVPSLEDVPSLGWGVGTPVVGDLRASGNSELFFTTMTNAYAISLQQAGTGLLRSVDDGKGTRLSFSYERAAPAAGLGKRPSVLASVTAQSSGYDDVVHSYGYGSPVNHTVGHFFVGFSETRKQSPLVSETVTFHHDDDLAGVVLSVIDTDQRTPDLVRFADTSYEEANVFGVRMLRPVRERTGHRATDGSADLAHSVEYGSYARGFCATQVTSSNAHGSLEKTLTLVDPSALAGALADALHCLGERETLTATHPDASRDFVLEQSLVRNLHGQVTEVVQHGTDGALTLQQVTYDSDHRVASIAQPGRGESRFDYDVATGRLSQLTGPDAVQGRVGLRDPVTDALQELVGDRGPGGVQTGYFRYDGMERLAKGWSSVGGSSEMLPLETVEYHFPTATQPGAVVARELIDAGGAYQESVAWTRADGEAFSGATRIPEGWAVGGVTAHQRQTLRSTSYRRSPLAPSTTVDQVTYDDVLLGAVPLGVIDSAGFGHPVYAESAVQEAVDKVVTTSVALSAGALIATATENGTTTTRAATDAEGRVLWSEDAMGTVTAYGYDAAGRLVAVTLPDGVVHTLSYDSYGRPALVSRPEVGSVAYEYDTITGLLAGKAYYDQVGVLERSVDHFYDSIGRLTEELHTLAATGESRSFGYFYDGSVAPGEHVPGQLGYLSRVTGDSFERTVIYDPLGRESISTLVLAEWMRVDVSTTYHAGGQVDETARTVTRLSDNAVIDDTVTEYLYDAWGRLAQVRLNGAALATIGYDAEGRLAGADLPGGDSITYSFDPRTHRSLGYDQVQGASGSAVQYSFNARGLIAGEQMTVGAEVRNRDYDYDARGFLSRSEDEASLATYTYSSIGLPDSIVDEAGTRTVARNGAASITVGNVVYTYDSLGRVVAKDNTSFEYGPDGHLASASDGVRSWRYAYDEGGNRLLKIEGGVPIAAYINGSYLTAESLVSPIKVGGQVVGIVENGVFQPLATDPRGTLLADQDGTPRFPSPYGVRTVRPDLSAALDYVEKGYDADLGTVRMGVRDYDPVLSQFLTPDPLFFESLDKCAESPVECNLYAYALNNPVMYVDPDGRTVYDVQSNEFRTEEGDSVGRIARQTGFQQKDIIKHNPSLKPSTFLGKGIVLNIPRNKRIRVFTNAAATLGSTAWSAAVSKGRFGPGSNKCNLYCSDIAAKSGLKHPRHWRAYIQFLGGEIHAWTTEDPVVAGDLGNSKLLLPGLDVVKESRARIGDIVAWKEDFSDATGHVSIFAADLAVLDKKGIDVRKSAGAIGGEWGVFSPGKYSVSYRTDSYLSSHEYTSSVFRTYTDGGSF